MYITLDYTLQVLIIRSHSPNEKDEKLNKLDLAITVEEKLCFQGKINKHRKPYTQTQSSH